MYLQTVSKSTPSRFDEKRRYLNENKMCTQSEKKLTKTPLANFHIYFSKQVPVRTPERVALDLVIYFKPLDTDSSS